MIDSPRNYALISAFAAGLGPVVVYPVCAANRCQHDDSTQFDIRRNDARPKQLRNGRGGSEHAT